MTDPKKRLAKILNNLCYNTMGNPPYRIDDATTEILKEFVHKDNVKDICPHGKRISHQYCRECSLKMIEEEYEHEKEIFDQMAKDRGYVHKDNLPSKDDLVTFLVDELVSYRYNKRFQFNARMSGKNWVLANWLAKAIRKLIEGKK